MRARRVGYFVRRLRTAHRLAGWLLGLTVITRHITLALPPTDLCHFHNAARRIFFTMWRYARKDIGNLRFGLPSRFGGKVGIVRRSSVNVTGYPRPLASSVSARQSCLHSFASAGAATPRSCTPPWPIMTCVARNAVIACASPRCSAPCGLHKKRGDQVA